MVAANARATRASSKISWVKIDGLGTQKNEAPGFQLPIGFASIGSSIFGRRPTKQEVRPPPQEAPYSPQTGTYAYDVLQRRFKEYDTGDHGYLDENGLKTALKDLKLPASEQDVQSFLNGFPEATVPFDQFADYAVQRENLLYDTFKELDKNNTGYLTVPELKSALQKYHFRVSDGDIASQVEKYAKGGVGPLNESELFDFSGFRNILLTFCKNDLRDASEVWGRAIVDPGDVDTTFPLSARPKKGGRYEKNDVFKHMFLGAATAAFTRTIVSPLERIKILSMVGTGEAVDAYHNISSVPANVWHKIWSDGKLSGLLRGNLLNIARIVPTRVAEFLVYDKLKEQVVKRRKQSELASQDHFLLGCLASLAGVIAGYPLDTLRTIAASQLPNRHVDDLLVKSVVENGGLRTLYKGLVPNLARAVPYGLVTFTVFEKLQDNYRKKYGPGGEIRGISIILMGVAATLAAQTLVHPLEVVQRRLQVEAAKQGPAVYHNMLNAFGVIIEKEGPMGLYSGLAASYAKIVPATAVSLLVYKALKEKLDARSST